VKDAIPSDDLYARLGVTPEADTAAIDRAWRALLKQHHPDVAGSVSLQLAKLINVAHDWLGHPERRRRYDEAIRLREGRRTPRGRPAPTRPGPTGGSARPAPPPPLADDLDEVFGASGPAIRSFLAQAAALTRDDLDRLSVSEPAAAIDDLRDIVPPELWSRVETLDARLDAVLGAPVRANARAMQSARDFGRALVLELFLWFYLSDAEPLLEQLRRGWESSVGLPRYGPNTDEVAALVERLGRATAAQTRRLVEAWARIGPGDLWPADAQEFDFAALEVSAALARRDAMVAVAVPAGTTGAEATAVRAAAADLAQVVTLRPIFSRRAFTRFRPAWDVMGGPMGDSERTPRPVVRRA
jgi:curved DNA-binding protein CbpA